MWIGAVVTLLVELAGFLAAVWLFEESDQVFGIIALFVWTFLAFVLNVFLVSPTNQYSEEEPKPWTYVP